MFSSSPVTNMDRWFNMAPPNLRGLLKRVLVEDPMLRPTLREFSLEIRPYVSKRQKRLNKHFVNQHEVGVCDDEKPYNSVISNLHGVSIHIES